MFRYNYYSRFIQVRNGLSNGRSFVDCLMDGRVTVIGKDEKDQPFKRIVIFKDGNILDNKIIQKGKPTFHIVYGQFEKHGKNITRFHPKTGMGRHGKARLTTTLLGHKGVCHSEYKNGRLINQKFIYDNRKVAYNYNAFKKSFQLRSYDGQIMYEISGILANSQYNLHRGCRPILDDNMQNWFTPTKPFEVKKNGKIIYKGLMQNHQKVGEWVIDGKYFFYEKGVAIPKKLYETPPEKLDPLKILKLPNAQTRMALLNKVGPERIAKCGRVIHKEDDMRLYVIPKLPVKILRVKCPTTKAFYYLRVPSDSTNCEAARQWTFHVGTHFDKPIKFEKET